MPDLTTLLSKFLTDLYAGTLGVSNPIASIVVGDGTLAAPSIARATTPTMGLYFPDAFSVGGTGSGVVSTRMVFGAAGGVYENAAGVFGWVSTNNAVSGSVDTTLSRSAAGVLAVGTNLANNLGTVDATSYKAGGTAGVATFGPAGVVSITVKAGLITAIS